MHCYLGEKNRDFELPIDHTFKIIKSLTQANVLAVNITGGEPFLMRNFDKVIEKLIDHQIMVGAILTNGTVIDKNILNLLQNVNMNTSFFISLDGCKASTHDTFRGVYGAFERCLRNIKKVIDFGFPVGINTSITKINENEIFGIYDLILKLGVKRWRVERPLPVGNWKNKTDLHVSLSKEIEIYKGILSKWSDRKPIELELGHFFRFFKFKVENEHYTNNSFVCDYYRDSLCIMPNGDVTPCASLTSQEFVFGNATKESIKDIWRKPEMKHFKDLRVSDLLRKECNSKCKHCPFLRDCGSGCRANAFALTRDVYHYDPIMCSIYCEYTSGNKI